jgi:hypothetical protein
MARRGTWFKLVSESKEEILNKNTNNTLRQVRIIWLFKQRQQGQSLLLVL